MPLAIPAKLVTNCLKTPERAAWLEQLAGAVEGLLGAWSLTVAGPPVDGDEVSAAWIAPVTRADGTAAVLKLGMPHFEAEHELDGLRFWNGDPTVRLFEADADVNAMLLERCEPGTVLRSLPEPEQDVVLAGLLRRLWRSPAEPHPFRSLAAMTAAWSEDAVAAEDLWPDPGIVREGLGLFEELPRTASAHVLLATDLHAGNVLVARREPWLAIDPKPFVGDPAYDATQHLLNCRRLHASPLQLVHRLADLFELDRERVRLWTFARVAVDSRHDPVALLAVARALAP